MKRPQRKLILGIDEAGYGPNIGPLVIACSAWIVEEKSSDRVPASETMLGRLSPHFLPKSVKAPANHIPLGDSKAIYVAGESMDGLSLGVRFWLNEGGVVLTNFQALLDSVAPTVATSADHLLWYQPSRSSPSNAEQFNALDEFIPDAVQRSAIQTYQTAGLQFLGLAAVAIDERQFNCGVKRLGNKASLLSQASLNLASECLTRHASQHRSSIDSIHVYCDKHGGRNRYQALLMHVMPEIWFDALQESQARSDYRATWHDLEMKWSFLAKGDRLFASALASMTAKWIREGMMARLNAFWQTHLPHLRATAGYPGDAKRFRTEIEPIAMEQKYAIEDWWRTC